MSPAGVVTSAVRVRDERDAHLRPRSRRDAHSAIKSIMMRARINRRSTGSRPTPLGADDRDGPTRSTSSASGALASDEVATRLTGPGTYATALTIRDHHSRCAFSEPVAPAMRQRQLSSYPT